MARGTVTGPEGMGLVNALFSGGRWVTGMLASIGFVGKEGIDGIDSISSGAFGAKMGSDNSMSAEVGAHILFSQGPKGLYSLLRSQVCTYVHECV